jgi:iron complex outermembrane receptor protein
MAKSYFLYCLAMGAGVLASDSAWAQANSASGAVAEIVVTAERRATRLQDVPLAVNAITGQDARAQQLRTIEDLTAQLPGLNISRAVNTTMVSIRGVGSASLNTGNESRVATYVDDIYVSQTGQLLNPIFDVGRIEYLRGPQVTLYGRNSTAGAINIINAEPTGSRSGFATATLGNYWATRVEGALNEPLTDSWSARLSFLYDRHDGYDRDLTSGRRIDDLEQGALRAKLKYSGEDFSVVLGAHYGREDDSSGAFRYIGPGNPFVTPLGVALGGKVAPTPDIATDSVGFPTLENEYYGAYSNAAWSLGENRITAIVGYMHSDKHAIVDIDGTDLPLATATTFDIATQYTGELRFQRSTERYELLAGVTAFYEKLTGFTPLPLSLQIVGGPPIIVKGVLSGGRQVTNAYAAYAQIRWNFTPALYADVGARYSYDRKRLDDGFVLDFATPYDPNAPLEFSSPVHHRQSWNSFDPKLTLGWKPSEAVLVYGTITRGFKSGGFSFGSAQESYEPERITNIEGGLKITTPDRRLTFRGAAFYYRYSNMQVLQIDERSQAFTSNASKAEIKGLEVESTAQITDGLSVSGSAEYLEAEYVDYLTAQDTRPDLGQQQLAGNPLPQSPKYRIRIAPTYRWSVGSGQVTLSGDATWIGRIYFTPFKARYASAPPSVELNANLRYALDDWTFGAYIRNIADDRKFVYAQGGSALFGYGALGSVNAPRTFGVLVSREW